MVSTRSHDEAETSLPSPSRRGWDRLTAKASNPRHSSSQITAGFLTSVFACAAATCGILWIVHYRLSFIDLASLFATTKSRFLLHPIAMFAGVLLFLTHGCLVWRMPEILVSRGYRQLFHHAGANDVGVLLVGFGLWATYSTHEHPHIHSMHAWFGVVTTILLLSQVVAGLTFILPRSLAMRLVPIGFHKRMGILTLIAALTTVTTGLMDYTVMLVKDKKVGKESNEMWLINFTGLFVLATMMSFLYTLLPQEASGKEIAKRNKEQLLASKVH